MAENDTQQMSLSASLNATDIFADWDKLLQAPVMDDHFMDGLELAEQDQSHWESLFNEMNFPGMDLMVVPYYPDEAADFVARQKFLNRTIRDFTRFLSYHHANDLRAAGVTEEGLFYMKHGQIPENFTVHLKYPLDYGGKVDFENLVFIQARPFHELIHLYLNKQILGPEGALTPAQLYVPVPTGKVYIPLGLLTGSGGKNKQDRSVVAGFSENALRDLALRSMPGR